MKLINRCYYAYKHYGLKQTIERVLFHIHLIPSHNMDIRTLQEYNFYMNLPVEKYEDELKNWYGRITGRNLNLNNPKTLNEKIQWLKLYDSTALKTKLADKYLVREWIKEKIGEEYLIPLLGVWDKFDDIDFDKLPNQFVLKTNHGSGWNIIVKDKNNFDKEETKKKLELWLKLNYAFISGFEMHYLNIPPKIIAEKYIEQIDQVYDYKFMCFNGKVEFMWVDTDRFIDHKRTIFNKKWEKQNIKLVYKIADYDIPKPRNFERMINFAELLSENFVHTRVDFYEIGDKLYFGEITFTSGSGTEEPEPYKYTMQWGDLLKLPDKSPIPKIKS